MAQSYENATQYVLEEGIRRIFKGNRINRFCQMVTLLELVCHAPFRYTADCVTELKKVDGFEAAEEGMQRFYELLARDSNRFNKHFNFNFHYWGFISWKSPQVLRIFFQNLYAQLLQEKALLDTLIRLKLVNTYEGRQELARLIQVDEPVRRPSRETEAVRPSEWSLEFSVHGDLLKEVFGRDPGSAAIYQLVQHYKILSQLQPNLELLCYRAQHSALVKSGPSGAYHTARTTGIVVGIFGVMYSLIGAVLHQYLDPKFKHLDPKLLCIQTAILVMGVLLTIYVNSFVSSKLEGHNQRRVQDKMKTLKRQVPEYAWLTRQAEIPLGGQTNPYSLLYPTLCRMGEADVTAQRGWGRTNPSAKLSSALALGKPRVHSP